MSLTHTKNISLFRKTVVIHPVSFHQQVRLPVRPNPITPDSSHSSPRHPTSRRTVLLSLEFTYSYHQYTPVDHHPKSSVRLVLPVGTPPFRMCPTPPVGMSHHELRVTVSDSSHFSTRVWSSVLGPLHSSCRCTRLIGSYPLSPKFISLLLQVYVIPKHRRYSLIY